MRRLIALLPLALLSAGCGNFSLLGYTTHGLYPDNIRTIAVPIFHSDSFRRDLEFKLTEETIKRLERVGFKVVDAERADTELHATITGFDKNGAGLDGYGNPRGGVMTLNVRIRWIDKRSGRNIVDNSFKIDPAPYGLSSQEQFLTDPAQSIATANDRMVKEMAQNIAALIQTPW